MVIQFQQVFKKYQGAAALTDISFTIASHELFVLVGPSGSGKTTLLKMINRLNTPTSGQILIDDLDVMAVPDVREFRRGIGYVLQAGALFPNMTVAENASIQLAAQNVAQGKRDARVRELLNAVGLASDKFMNRMPNELSGGEAQRVGIVRALAAEPNIVLMDEPFSALDPLSRRQLQDLVVKLHQQFNTTIIFVTHDMDEALRLADRLAVINDGKLQQVGTPDEILATPANQFVAEFFANAGSQSQYVKSVLAAGFGHPVTGSALVSLPETAMLSDWAALLQQSPTAMVGIGDVQLAPADLIAYLAQAREVQ
ncbi:L-proline glycine betaine ABC transport system permease protein ProV [Fructilactobacillus florum 8D]|uniref:ABC-type quaternary amine transporter n=1 Tax=Fructilactobacillus florum 8D TaxID=1221538 RepID=W9EET5_9LACO|nr:ABC transporter ATP-binding protein [Fructilactobacillus florum]EKK21153.1 L-proline glycine betaine ABC transport system permease protein ProV [Fructilactobacillus florum 2F]ETO40592.1 L-proline glycine betaine ABC transport system permease protein ProV [Fructilactobacillus florum 8D]